MGINTLKTGNFSAATKYAQGAAEQMETIKSDLLASKNAALLHWVGDGRASFQSLFAIVDQQIGDMAGEFWDLFDNLCTAEAAYLEADNSVSSAIESSTAE